ncbi:MAG TPA: dephospho-CoA kinase [Candidatus Sulfobium mesophilum]|nr:dephospho-CoA kinase [Candidatus Sulfobium mesophilum]
MAALTGNFGMGKSYVLSLFRELGAVTLESDRIVGMLLKKRGVIQNVAEILGDDVVTPEGSLDKEAVARKIFHDREMKNKLEALLHPLVFEKVRDFTKKIKNKDSLVIVEVPLLFEGDYQAGFEKVITVCTSDETALKRLAMVGVSESDALARLRSQLPISEKKVRADYVIDNSGSKEQTKKQVEDVYRLLRREIAKRKD